MFCSQCGAKVEGNFCCQCGSKLSSAGGNSPAASLDWADEVRYEVLLANPEIRQEIARFAADAPKRMSGEDFLKLADKAFVPLTGVSVTAVATLAQPLYGKLGIRTGKTRNALYTLAPGRVLVRTLCSLARHGWSMRRVNQGQDGCVIEATLPSDLWSFEGELLITVRRHESGTAVEAATHINGTWFDWGKSQRALDELLSDMQALPIAA